MTYKYPLDWPQGWPRTPSHERKRATTFSVTAGAARDGLYEELERHGARQAIITTSLALGIRGEPTVTQRADVDPGVAVYFDAHGRSLVLARDLYVTPWANMRAITLCLAALRALERHGGAEFMERAFTGFAALPAGPTAPKWREMLGLRPNDDLEMAEAHYRAMARNAHPDVGGSDHEMAVLNAAIEAARKELGS